MSPITFKGDSIIPRYETGLYSLDRAFHKTKLGVPASGFIEIYGVSHVGKSTFVYSLAAILAKIKETNITLWDNEGFDQEFFLDVVTPLGFDGTVYCLSEETDEGNLDKIINNISKNVSYVGIIDSVGGISPMGELKGSTGEANMGRRAFILGQFSRKLAHENGGQHKAAVLFTNHIQANLGGYGMSTPGGKATEYGASIKILMSRDETFPPKSKLEIGYVLKGTVNKNRWGGKGREFRVCMLSGRGVHKGLTALFDCVALKLVTRTRTLKIGEESIGYLKDYFGYAINGDEHEFDKFHELLNDYNPNSEEEVLDDE